MKDTDILFSIALMILGIVLMYKSMKGNSCRQRLAKLADSIASDKENINFQIKRFGYLLDEMAADNEKNSILKCQMCIRDRTDWRNLSRNWTAHETNLK